MASKIKTCDSSECPRDMPKKEAADSLIFPVATTVLRARSLQRQNALPVKVRIETFGFARFRLRVIWKTIDQITK